MRFWQWLILLFCFGLLIFGGVYAGRRVLWKGASGRSFSGTHSEDVHFYSQVLKREAVYRIVGPDPVPAGKKLPVIWLLHGANADYSNWTDASDIGQLAQQGVLLVSLDALDTYWVNSATNPNDNYEDYLFNEVMPDVRRHYPTADTTNNAIFGFSRGGYGALTIALKHPAIFKFVAVMSGTIGLAEYVSPHDGLLPIQRANRDKIDATLGTMDSLTRRQNDPFMLVYTTKPMPYIYLVSNRSDKLLPLSERFAEILKKQGLPYEHHVADGTHDWTFWGPQLPGIEKKALQCLHVTQ